MADERWVHAEGLGVRGPRGWVFREAGLMVGRGEIAALDLPSGGGRTSLLLTLAGRMRPHEGTGTVAGFALPGELRRIQSRTALGVMAAVNELEPELTVREHLAEALSVRGLRRRARIAEALDRVGLEADPGTIAYALDPAERQLLGIAIALTGGPEVLFLDDVDAGLDPGARSALWERITEIGAEQGVTIVATCDDPDAAPARVVRPSAPVTA